MHMMRCLTTCVQDHMLNYIRDPKEVKPSKIYPFVVFARVDVKMLLLTCMDK